LDKRYYILGGALILLIVFGTLFFISSREPKESELNFVTSSEDEKNFEGIIPAFEQANNVKVNFLKKNVENYELESLNLLSTGKIDVWGIPYTWLAKQKNKLAAAAASLSESYMTLYPESIAKQNSLEGQYYGAPLSLDALVLFKNPELISSARSKSALTDKQSEALSKSPDNWDIIGEQAKLITSKSGSSVTISGLALGSPNIDAASDILTILMLQNGTQMTNQDNTQATFHTAVNKFGGANFPGARALEYFAKFGQKNSLYFAFSDSLGDNVRAFSEGKVAYLIDYAKKEAEIKRINPDLNYEILSLPQVKETQNPVNLLSYETLTVPQTSKNQTLAWKFIEFLLEQNNYDQYYNQSGNYPALSYMIQNAQGVVEKSIAQSEYWYNPDPTQVEEIFKEAITQATSGINPQTALESASLKVTELLGKLRE